MFRIFPHSISQETGEKVDELQTHLKIFEFLRVKMSDDSDGGSIISAEGTSAGGTSAEGTSAETQYKESTETHFS